nr:hypothetical protein [Corallococcus coralloides]
MDVPLLDAAERFMLPRESNALTPPPLLDDPRCIPGIQYFSQALKSEDRAGYVLTVQQAQSVCREVSTRLVLEAA